MLAAGSRCEYRQRRDPPRRSPGRCCRDSSPGYCAASSSERRWRSASALSRWRRGQPGDDGEAPVAAGRGRRRQQNPHVALAPDLKTSKARRALPQSESAAADRERPAHNLGGAAVLLGDREADDGGRLFTGASAVRQQPAGGRGHLQHGKNCSETLATRTRAPTSPMRMFSTVVSSIAAIAAKDAAPDFTRDSPDTTTALGRAGVFGGEEADEPDGRRALPGRAGAARRARHRPRRSPPSQGRGSVAARPTCSSHGRSCAASGGGPKHWPGLPRCLT